MPTPHQIEIIKEALDQSDELTPWEYDFIMSIADLPNNRPLTEKQAEVLHRIGEKL